MAHVLGSRLALRSDGGRERRSLPMDWGHLAAWWKQEASTIIIILRSWGETFEMLLGAPDIPVGIFTWSSLWSSKFASMMLALPVKDVAASAAGQKMFCHYIRDDLCSLVDKIFFFFFFFFFFFSVYSVLFSG
ncbi:hypothetical protein JEZ13_06290 [bacterium]|nr:hypothetical protein [bacterium]